MESTTVSKAARHREHPDGTVAETNIPVINVMSRSDQAQSLYLTVVVAIRNNVLDPTHGPFGFT
ncbi:MAG TPA: hypothetical protein PKK23_16180 [Nitrospirales bacterium]|nr:hypothetical protein [Nitrospirales bacterium]